MRQLQFKETRADRHYHYLIYFISDEPLAIGSRVKVGFTKDINERMFTLQAGNPRQLNILKVIHIEGAHNVKRAEKKLHAMFRDQRLTREWFTANEDMISIIDGSTDIRKLRLTYPG
jgi:hypothetical protein